MNAAIIEYISPPPPSVPVPGTRYSRETTEPMTVRWRYNSPHGPLPPAAVTAPVGTRHDGPSIPRWLHWLEPRTNRMYRAAIIHDRAYVTNEIDRDEADLLYYSILRYDGLDRLSATAHWLAVRAFGWLYY